MWSAAIRVVFAIHNQMQPNATLLLGVCCWVVWVFFSLIFYFSLTLPLLFILSFQALISSVTEIQWQSDQDLHFQFNKTSENDLLNQWNENAGGAFQESLSSWAWLHRMAVVALISFDMNSVLMILTLTVVLQCFSVMSFLVSVPFNPVRTTSYQ